VLADQWVGRKLPAAKQGLKITNLAFLLFLTIQICIFSVAQQLPLLAEDGLLGLPDALL